MSWEPSFAAIAELSAAFRNGTLSPVTVTRELLERIERHDRALGSYLSIRADEALAEAKAAERAWRAGRPRSPLHGVPLAVKDNVWTRDLPTTAHSRTLLAFVPPADATSVRRLREAGMIVLGKTNTTEFACGDMAVFGPSRNPWDLQRFSGASSGGSAAAVAAGLAVAALGSDTGGSIRAPASFCGVVGLKPTYGRVSRYGLIPLSWSMDAVGPIARTVADVALLVAAMAGYDPRDPSSSRRPPPDATAALAGDARGLRVGVPQQHFFGGLEPAVERAVGAALAQLETLGAELQPLELPLAGKLAAAGNVLVMAEAFGRHAENLRRQAAAYGPKARRRIATGAFYHAAEVTRAEQLRARWLRQLTEAMQAVDVLVTPTLPFTAFTIEQQLDSPPDTSWGTRQFNLAGFPALTLPCGFDEQGLPIGLQLAAKPFDEAVILRLGHAYEQATGWHRVRPELPTPELPVDGNGDRS